MARVKHNLREDQTCAYCNMVLQQYIPHECDPSICRPCKGKGSKWLGRDKETQRFLGWDACPDCGGTGKRRFGDDTLVTA